MLLTKCILSLVDREYSLMSELLKFEQEDDGIVGMQNNIIAVYYVLRYPRDV